jgi:hypothetical protein
MSTPRGSTATARRPPKPEAVGPSVRWKSWLLRDETSWTLRMLAAMLLGSLLVWLVTDKLHLALLAAAALLLSAWHLWVPREFAIDLAGLETNALGRQRRIGWDAIRRVEMLDDGILFWINRAANHRGTPRRKKLHSLFIPHHGDRTVLTKVIAEFTARTSTSNSRIRQS